MCTSDPCVQVTRFRCVQVTPQAVKGDIYYRKATKVEKDEKNFDCLAPNGVPKVCFAKKGVAR